MFCIERKIIHVGAENISSRYINNKLRFIWKLEVYF